LGLILIYFFFRGDRVGCPFVGREYGVTEGRPPFVLPWPPPCGWSTGFIATPRTDGRILNQRLRPAFSIFRKLYSSRPKIPYVAFDKGENNFWLPEGNFNLTYFVEDDCKTWQNVPADLAYKAPWFGIASTQWTKSPTSKLASTETSPIRKRKFLRLSNIVCKVSKTFKPLGAKI